MGNVTQEPPYSCAYTSTHDINPVFLSSNLSHWSAEELYEFIASLQGFQEIAEEFCSQEMGGKALF